MQTYHSCTRNTDTHTILEDVSAHLYFNTEICIHSPVGICEIAFLLNDFHGLGYSKSYSNGFSTTQCRLHFLFDQFDDLGLTCGHLLKKSKVMVMI